MRRLLAAIPIAAVLAMFGGTQPAGANTTGGDQSFTTIGDQCAQYIFNYQAWAGEYVMEVSNAGYETPYAVYAYSRVQYYGNLISYYSC